jgi:hypothetical protein
MAYDTKELERQALEAIKNDPDIAFIEDVVACLPCGKVTFYEHKLNELNTIKSALEKNKIEGKKYLRNKWKDSDNATVQVALYKILGNDGDRDKLNPNSKVDHNVQGGIKITIEDLDEKYNDPDE